MVAAQRLPPWIEWALNLEADKPLGMHACLMSGSSLKADIFPLGYHNTEDDHSASPIGHLQ